MSHLPREIDLLKKRILRLAAQVERSLQQAVTAIETRDALLADTIVQNDSAIDQAEVDVEEECLKILALHQPMAQDLRFIVSVLKVNNDLERIGDLAVEIAELAVSLSSQNDRHPHISLSPLAIKTQDLLSRALDSLMKSDTGVARDVCVADDEVDVLDESLEKVIRDTLRGHPESVDALIPVLEAAHHLERVADHATNIAEDVIYMEEGAIVRHLLDDSSRSE